MSIRHSAFTWWAGVGATVWGPGSLRVTSALLRGFVWLCALRTLWGLFHLLLTVLRHRDAGWIDQENYAQ